MNYKNWKTSTGATWHGYNKYHSYRITIYGHNEWRLADKFNRPIEYFKADRLLDATQDIERYLDKLIG